MRADISSSLRLAAVGGEFVLQFDCGASTRKGGVLTIFLAQEAEASRVSGEGFFSQKAKTA